MVAVSAVLQGVIHAIFCKCGVCTKMLHELICISQNLGSYSMSMPLCIKWNMQLIKGLFDNYESGSTCLHSKIAGPTSFVNIYAVKHNDDKNIYFICI